MTVDLGKPCQRMKAEAVLFTNSMAESPARPGRGLRLNFQNGYSFSVIESRNSNIIFNEYEVLVYDCSGSQVLQETGVSPEQLFALLFTFAAKD